MSILLGGDSDVAGVESVGIELTTAQMLELRRHGRVEFDAPGGPTVVIGHEDRIELAEEVDR